MAMILYLEGSIDKEMVNHVSTSLNSFGMSPIDIYINSDGGNISCMEEIVSMINNHTSPQKNIFCYGCLSSSAFELFFKVNANRYIGYSIDAMYHAGRIYVNGNAYINDSDKYAYSSYVSKLKEKTISFLKGIGLNEDSIAYKTILDSGDYYFTYDEMVDLVKANSLSSKKMKGK